MDRLHRAATAPEGVLNLAVDRGCRGILFARSSDPEDMVPCYKPPNRTIMSAANHKLDNPK